MSTNHTAPSSIDVLEGVATGLTGLGIVTLALFPLALPIIILTAAVAIPVLLVGLVVGVVVAAPIALVRRLRRRVIEPSRAAAPAKLDARGRRNQAAIGVKP